MVAVSMATSALAVLKLGGKQLPGIIPKGGITGWSRKTSWKVAKGKGSDGATLTDEGDDPPSGKVKLQFWTDEQLAAWEQTYGMLRAARAAKTALDIAHPMINAQEVTSIVVEEIGVLTEIATGLWEVELSLIQWLPSPKPAGGKPAGSATDQGGTPEGNGEGAGGAKGTVEEEKTQAEKDFEYYAEEAQKPV